MNTQLLIDALTTTEGYTLMGCVFGAIALRMFINYLERSQKH